MISELAVERVEFTCGHCWRQWSMDFDVQHYQDELGGGWEYFSLDGVPVYSPYSQEGAQACPECNHRWVGHLAARRVVPLAASDAEAPKIRIGDRATHRPDRHTAPPLPGSQTRTEWLSPARGDG